MIWAMITKSVGNTLGRNGNNVRTAPLSFATLAIVSVSAGFTLGMFYYSGQLSTLHEQIGTLHEQIREQSGRIRSYRVALGIDQASEGALIELNNEELRAKGINRAAGLRELCFTQQRKAREIEKLQSAGKIDSKTAFQRVLAMHEELSQQFARTMRADAFNVDTELRRRLSPEAVSGIVGFGRSVVADDGARVDLLGLFPPGAGVDVEFSCILAEGIEQMSRMLPATAKEP